MPRRGKKVGISETQDETTVEEDRTGTRLIEEPSPVLSMAASSRPSSLEEVTNLEAIPERNMSPAS